MLTNLRDQGEMPIFEWFLLEGYDLITKCSERHLNLHDLVVNFILQIVKDKEEQFFHDYLPNLVFKDDKSGYFDLMINYIIEIDQDLIFTCLGPAF